MSKPFPCITGAGGFLPGPAIPNQQHVDRTGIRSSGDWILERTGIECRHRVTTQTACDLALAASRHALGSAGVEPGQLSAILVATVTADRVGPSTASMLHGRLGAAPDCKTAYVSASCTGWLAGTPAAADARQQNPAPPMISPC